jgi:hypothetical protein
MESIKSQVKELLHPLAEVQSSSDRWNCEKIAPVAEFEALQTKPNSIDIDYSKVSSIILINKV